MRLVVVGLTAAAVVGASSVVGLGVGWQSGASSVELAASIGLDAGSAGPAVGFKPGAVPAEYAPLFVKAAAEYGCSVVTPLLLAAQVKAESGFNADAVSNVGALGPAQFLPSTWAAHGVDGDGDGRKDIRNPADAIPAQAKYDCEISRQVRRVPGDPEAVMLAGYLYGPYGVIRRGGIPSGAWSYIRRIQGFEKELGAPIPSGGGAAVPAGVLGEMIRLAKDQRGKPYVFGAAGPNSFDCSGLVLWALKKAGGPSLPHSSEMQYDRLRHITEAEARPGDLVFFNWGEFQAGKPGHVGIYLGNGYFVGAQSSHRPLSRQIAIDPVKGFSNNRTEFARIELS